LSGSSLPCIVRTRMIGDIPKKLYVAAHYLDLDRPQAALDALDRVQLSGDEDEAVVYWHVRAMALVGLERFDDSADAASRGLAIDPESVELLVALAAAELGRRNPKQAERELDRALSIAPDSAQLWAVRAVLLTQQGRFKAAGEIVPELVQQEPDELATIGLRAWHAIYAGDERAEEYVEQALALEPEDSWAHSLRAELAFKRGDIATASAAMAEAARLDPKPYHVRTARAYRLFAGTRFWRAVYHALRLIAPVGPYVRGRFFVPGFVVLVALGVWLDSAAIGVLAFMSLLLFLGWESRRLRWRQGHSPYTLFLGTLGFVVLFAIGWIPVIGPIIWFSAVILLVFVPVIAVLVKALSQRWRARRTSVGG